MLGLGIESSCDETSVGIVQDGKIERSLRIFSQTELHSRFHGVVPEIASRAHLEKINYLLDAALSDARISLSNLNYIAVANRPGLLGSLMIGAQLAKVLSLCLRIPVIAVDHLESHLSAVQLEGNILEYPFLGLLLSGGNSAVFKVDEPGKMTVLADTRDDALGEALDKAAILLGLGYPGGPLIEKKAAEFQGERKGALFPKVNTGGNNRFFSYSGLKTSLLYFTRKNPDYISRIPEVCWHYQNSAFELVEKNISKLVSDTGIHRVVAAGGVLANTFLRERLEKLSVKKRFQLIYPKKKLLCTDNGAMTACLGYYLFQAKKISGLDFAVSPYREET
ncbi:MAG TPA: tRNA (adenosine(37)-N6)-threonylcarbamoyltransferase complex transferase subunit TsaD [Leptospiraceae bacterium]|nr:tRNA (adenosine(37)-N6)-threonylcarbamoyltransferase complex transferase subunit TsaD [Leptospiraceae bacterium]HMY69185.1 tRNA (adenosine(37)-N6)-threonylcarbamoyltransferase complex transferase subunit TsaD [Leptospiraceae bacterium]HNF23107.1 tRNA (adenosine(37)-N6)-threonylcarbamoyltransferase complex transferase subunit TsaD [Leptospiraceae bacterium]HNM02192.1 tRNA (adenosine(37)-N6)-threonylcarbamoyltransferase complex transferase subunit TsaD [Leptospiraceae bacterium]HNN05510.1 tRNA